jgi:tetratricopeptide (TPR) repeat protein
VLSAGLTVLLALAGVAAVTARLRTMPEVKHDEAFDRAIAAWKTGDLPRARAAFTELLASERTANVLFFRGEVAAEMGDGRAALADFDAALALEPGPSWELKLCEVASDENAVAEALGDRGLAACERAVAGNPLSPRSYFGRGWVHADRREYEAALRDLDRALELRPGDELGRAKRAWVLARLDRLGDADKECDALFGSPRVDAAAIWACTDVALRRGDLVKARARLGAPGAEGLDPERRRELDQRIARRAAATGSR